MSGKTCGQKAIIVELFSLNPKQNSTWAFKDNPTKGNNKDSKLGANLPNKLP